MFSVRIPLFPNHFSKVKRFTSDILFFFLLFLLRGGQWKDLNSLENKLKIKPRDA